MNNKSAQKRIIDFFKTLDKNGDGEVSKVEIISAIRKQDSSEVSSVFQLPDQIRQEDGSRDLFMKFFHDIDADGSGNIGLQELMHYFEKNPHALKELPPAPASASANSTAAPPKANPAVPTKSKPFVAKPSSASTSPVPPDRAAYAPGHTAYPATSGTAKGTTASSPPKKSAAAGARTAKPTTTTNPPPSSAPSTNTTNSSKTSATGDVFKLTEKEAILFFNSLDRNGDGQVSKTELLAAIRTQGPSTNISTVFNLPTDVKQEDGTRDLFMEVFNEIDTDGSGGISVVEFVNYLRACRVYDGCQDSSQPGVPSPTKKYSSRFVDWAFNKIDTDKSGSITKMELITALRTSQHLSQALRLPREVSMKDGSKQRLESLFASIDTDGSKELSKQEFILFFEKMSL